MPRDSAYTVGRPPSVAGFRPARDSGSTGPTISACVCPQAVHRGVSGAWLAWVIKAGHRGTRRVPAAYQPAYWASFELCQPPTSMRRRLALGANVVEGRLVSARVVGANVADAPVLGIAWVAALVPVVHVARPLLQAGRRVRGADCRAPRLQRHRLRRPPIRSQRPEHGIDRRS